MRAKSLIQMARVTRLELAASAVTEVWPHENMRVSAPFKTSHRPYLAERIKNIKQFGCKRTVGLRLFGGLCLVYEGERK